MFGKSKKAARRQRERELKKRKNHREVSIFGGLAAGVIAGLVATWALDKYQEGALQATRRVEKATHSEHGLSRQQEEQLREQRHGHAEAAQRIAKTIGRKLSRSQKHSVAPVVHYAAGAIAGGAYGVAAEILPGVRRWYGMGFSKAIFLGGAEPLLPLLGLTARRKVAVTPAGLPAPLVFGAVLETTRRLLRWMF